MSLEGATKRCRDFDSINSVDYIVPYYREIAAWSSVAV